MSKKRKKIRSLWKTIASCFYDENIRGMVQQHFYSDTIEPKKISSDEYEINNLKGKIDFLRVRFDQDKNRFLFEQKINS